MLRVHFLFYLSSSGWNTCIVHCTCNLVLSLAGVCDDFGVDQCSVTPLFICLWIQHLRRERAFIPFGHYCLITVSSNTSRTTEAPILTTLSGGHFYTVPRSLRTISHCLYLVTQLCEAKAFTKRTFVDKIIGLGKREAVVYLKLCVCVNFYFHMTDFIWKETKWSVYLQWLICDCFPIKKT